jgi:hypothetical protein
MFTKSTAQIGNSVATVFLAQESNEYFYSLTSIAELIGKPASSASEFLTSKVFKAMYGKEFQPWNFQEDNLIYKLLPCDVASLYLTYWCSKGNKIATAIVVALTVESLELRAKNAFGNLTLESVVESLQKTNDKLITEIRVDAKAQHNIFQRACYGSKMNPSLVHDRITKLVFGYTAKEARDLPMTDLPDDVWLNEAIGINHEHTKDPVLMQQYRDMKTKIFSYRKEKTWEEKVDRAYREVVELV